MSDFPEPHGSTLKSGRILYSASQLKVIAEIKKERARILREQRFKENPETYKSIEEVPNPEINDSEITEEDISNFSQYRTTVESAGSSDSYKSDDSENFGNPSDIEAESTKIEKTLAPSTSIDKLNEDKAFIKFRKSLLEPKPIMAQNEEQKLSLTEFSKAIPECSGLIKDLQHFIACCDYFYETLSPQQKGDFLKALVRKLTGKAFNLFHNREWADWPTFKAELKKYFAITKSFETFQLELANIRQGKESIQDYSQRIEEILFHLNTIGKDIRVNNVSGEHYFKAQNEKLALKAFLNGLNSPLKNILLARKYNELKEAVKDAIELEVDLRLNKPKQQTFCNYCKRDNHTIDKCFRRNQNNSLNQNQNNSFNRNNSNSRFYNGNNSRFSNNSSNGQNSFKPNFNSVQGNRNTSSSNGNHSQNFSNRNNFNSANQNHSNNGNNNSNRNNGNRSNNGNNQRSNGSNNGTNRVRFIESEQKNEVPQTAQMDNAALNLLLN